MLFINIRKFIQQLIIHKIIQMLEWLKELLFGNKEEQKQKKQEISIQQKKLKQAEDKLQKESLASLNQKSINNDRCDRFHQEEIQEYNYPRVVYLRTREQPRIKREERQERNLYQQEQYNNNHKNSYPYQNKDAKALTKLIDQSQPVYDLQQCRDQMKQYLESLGPKYNFYFRFQEQQETHYSGKKLTMTRIIYLKYYCKRCNNHWDTISGTFQAKFSYDKQMLISNTKYNYPHFFKYYIRIFDMQCRKCKQLKNPQVPRNQMQAMKIYFAKILTNIMLEKEKPKKPKKYYIMEQHFHKSQLCDACKLGRCATQVND